MPTTPTYGLPYPSLSDPPNGPAQFQALAEEVEVELTRVDARIATDAGLLSGYAPGTQTASGSLAPGGSGVVVSTISVTDPGFSYHVIAGGSVGWGMILGSVPGNLFEGSVTVDSTTYNTNRISAGYQISHSIGAGFTQPTLIVPMKRSDALGAFTGAHTVRLMIRNSGVNDMTIPASSPDTTFMVRVVRA